MSLHMHALTYRVVLSSILTRKSYLGAKSVQKPSYLAGAMPTSMYLGVGVDFIGRPPHSPRSPALVHESSGVPNK